MKKDTIKHIGNNIVGMVIAFAIAYVVGSFMFDYELGSGILAGLFDLVLLG